MYPATQTIWLEATDTVALGLRRYHRSPDASGFTCEAGYHSALHMIGTGPARRDERGYIMPPKDIDRGDSRWPNVCDSCGYMFTDDDQWQEWSEQLYTRSDTGETTTLRDAPPGSCWNAWWMPGLRPDGIYLMVRCPNGQDWAVDSQASNCTRPGEPHACWVRHGDPRDCNVTVDKNGDTCSAGAGSIVAGDYHGFLQSGVLTAG